MSENLSEFENKRVIITGAGKGIGRATAIEMAKRGAKVIAMARTQSDLDSLKTDNDCEMIKVDLSDTVAARAAMKKAGTCDFLINNAGTADICTSSLRNLFATPSNQAHTGRHQSSI